MTKIRELMPWNNPASVLVRKSENMGSSLMALQEEMNRLFDHFFTGTQLRLTDWDQKLATAPAINVVEDGASFKVEAELAGIDPKHVEVEITGNYLTLKGERKEEKEEKKEGGNYLRQEISYGSFLRTVALPETVDSNKTTASFKNGILTITVPKKAEAQQKPKKVEIKAAA
jgi:HSP20 family protein